MVLWSLAFWGACLAQEPPEIDIDALLRGNAHQLRVEDGALAGPGAAFLSAAVAGTQFVAIGEQHNNREIPQFTTALFRLLNGQEGYEFLILEQDPPMMRQVSQAPVKGNLEAIQSLAKKYLKGFTFISDEELQMIADVGAIADSEAHVIWGCEQAFGVTHILDALRELAPTDAARAYVDKARETSAAAEAARDLDQGHYIYDAELIPTANELDRLFSGVEDPQAAFLIEAIRKSNEIYGYYKAGDRGEIPGYYSNNFVREEYMKTRCLDEYRLAERLDGKRPRGLMKFGHWHLYKGLSPARLVSLGSFMHDFARSNDAGYFSIAVNTFNADNEYGAFADVDATAYLKPFTGVATEGQWTLVDLRPFREYPRRRALAESAGLDGEPVDDLNALIYGFDSLLLIGGAQPATYQTTGVEY